METRHPAADGAGGGDDGIEDEVPAEWLRMLERKAAARREAFERAEAERREKRRRIVSVVEWAAPITVLVIVTAGLSILSASTSTSTSSSQGQEQSAPPPLPDAVKAFARSLPPSQHPNAAGLTVLDGIDAPTTWRVGWVTQAAAFCFAFVHQSAAPQTVCDAAGSVTSAQMRIAGELSDTVTDSGVIFTCGYTTGPAEGVDFVEVDGGKVVGAVTAMGSNLDGFCIQLPYDTTLGGSFTVSTYTSAVNTGDSKNKYVSNPVTATYPGSPAA